MERCGRPTCGGPLAQTPGNNAIALIPIGSIQRATSCLQQRTQACSGGAGVACQHGPTPNKQVFDQLLLTAPGAAKRIQLSQLRQKLALQGSPLAGWVLLDPDLKLG